MTVRCTDGFVKPQRQVSQRLITIFRYGVGSHDRAAANSGPSTQLGPGPTAVLASASGIS
jgi:hypothetical protein